MNRAVWHTNSNDRVNGFARSGGLAAFGLLLGWAGGANLVLASDEDLPKGEVILDKYVEATGGKAAHEKLHNRVVKGTFEMPAMGMKAAMTGYSAEPNKSYFLMESDALGKIEEGTNGDVAWATAPMTGPRCKEGADKARALRDADLHADVNWRKHFKEAKCVGVEDIDGRPCYKVVMTPSEGEPLTCYYDKQSHLLSKVDVTFEGPMGKMPIEVFSTDYKKVDGILMSHTTRVKVMGQERVLKIESIQHNVDIPADRFKLPDEIQALVDAAKAEEAKAEEAKTQPAEAD